MRRSIGWEIRGASGQSLSGPNRPNRQDEQKLPNSGWKRPSKSSRHGAKDGASAANRVARISPWPQHYERWAVRPEFRAALTGIPDRLTGGTPLHCQAECIPRGKALSLQQRAVTIGSLRTRSSCVFNLWRVLLHLHFLSIRREAPSVILGFSGEAIRPKEPSSRKTELGVKDGTNEWLEGPEKQFGYPRAPRNISLCLQQGPKREDLGPCT